jgi:predicted phage terminase large subunit-like protein
MNKKVHNHSLVIDSDKVRKIIKDAKLRRAVTRACHFWFFSIYFPHYVKYETAEFHKELFSLTEDETIRTIVVEAFRGSGKTTIMGMSYSIWAILGIQKRKFVLILAQTEAQARQYLANIKKELEANELLREDLGPFEEPNDEWRAISIVLPRYGARIMVASIDKPVRGIRHGQHRPQIIICDDLEDLDTVKTRESRDKVYNWLMGDVIPLGDKDTMLIVIGTRLHEDSILMRLRKELREGRMNGIAKSYPLLQENGITVWPGKYKTADDIEMLKKSLPSSQAWEREYLLRIIASDEQVVRPEWIHYYDELPPNVPESKFRYAATGVDPAISEETTADFTAAVSGRIYGRKNNLRMYILPSPINERMDFPKSLERIKSLSRALGNGSSTALWIEGVAFQKALIEQLRSDGYPAKEFKPQGQDKHARLSLASNAIQTGKVLFPRHGAETLIAQLTGFGVERYDDLADAFCILVLGILDQEWKTVKGQYPLIDDQLLERSYVDKVDLIGEKRLGVVLAGAGRDYSSIVLRTENVAQLVYHEMNDDVALIATKTIELAKKYEVALNGDHIFVDDAATGRNLADKIAEFVRSEFEQKRCGRTILIGKEPMLDHNQWYARNLADIGSIYKDQYVNMRSRSYWKLMEWMQTGGKLMGRPAFDDLLSIAYTVRQDNKIDVVGKEYLYENGIDASIADALMLTFFIDKKVPYVPYEQPPYEGLGVDWGGDRWGTIG